MLIKSLKKMKIQSVNEKIFEMPKTNSGLDHNTGVGISRLLAVSTQDRVYFCIIY